MLIINHEQNKYLTKENNNLKCMPEQYYKFYAVFLRFLFCVGSILTIVSIIDTNLDTAGISD